MNDLKPVKIFEKILRFVLTTLPLRIRRMFNNNKDFTLISRGCIGGLVYHQYGLKFLSPTINLFFDVQDFNLLCLHLKEYIDGQLVEDTNDGGYPVGILIPTSKSLSHIKIHFNHYKTYQEAQKKWNERKKRINWNNIYVINNFTYDYEIGKINNKIINSFNAIPYKKVVFVKANYGFDDEFVIGDKKVFYKNPYCWRYGFNGFSFNRFLKK